MTFLELLDGAETLYREGSADVTSVEYDSRQVSRGSLFVAMRGEITNGNRYIDLAIRNGAVAVVTDSATESPRPGIAWARVAEGRRALAIASANFYSHPAQFLNITGVTGTNGKTTTTFLLESILLAAHRQPLLLGTIEYHVGNQVLRSPHTTPESLELHRIFDQGVKFGANEAVLEVSSHALAQQRVYGLHFDVAVFTNLTRDHLDYHRDMEAYFAAKSLLFEGCGAECPRVAVVNADDPCGERLMVLCRKLGSEVFSYGIQNGDFRAVDCELSSRGTRFGLLSPYGKMAIDSSLIGRVNVYNIVAAAVAALARGCRSETVQQGVRAMEGVPGRFQTVDCGQPFLVVVDYAHTDDALKKLTSIARELVCQNGRSGRVITVFGCGGDRDKRKRPLMGKAAGEGSDVVILTSDNPRSEDPDAIIDDVLPGLESTGVKFIVEPDRVAAIGAAIGEARDGDVVLIAGKGHEKTQTGRAGAMPFDDVEVSRGVLGVAGFNSARRTAHAPARGSQ